MGLQTLQLVSAEEKSQAVESAWNRLSTESPTIFSGMGGWSREKCEEIKLSVCRSINPLVTSISLESESRRRLLSTIASAAHRDHEKDLLRDVLECIRNDIQAESPLNKEKK